MQARMQHPIMVLPAAYKALAALHESAKVTGIDDNLIELIALRASQINGCGVCVTMHSRGLKKSGESDERIFGVGAWHDSPFYTDAERAALALTEAVTRLADRSEAVSDEVWNEAAAHFNEEQLSAVLIAIAGINVWNRLNAATRQVAGSV